MEAKNSQPHNHKHAEFAGESALRRPGRLINSLAAEIGGYRSSLADESGVEPRKTGMVRREVRETGRGMSRADPAGRLIRFQACRPPQTRRFSLDTSCG